jgi:hypothetical protein
MHHEEAGRILPVTKFRRIPYTRSPQNASFLATGGRLVNGGLPAETRRIDEWLTLENSH